MRLEKREHPEAREELRQAAYWYEDQKPGLGEDFYGAIDKAITRIDHWPRSAPVFPSWVGLPEVRSMSVDIFPYRVLYYATDASFTVLAYAHQRRAPDYWRHRLAH